MLLYGSRSSDGRPSIVSMCSSSTGYVAILKNRLYPYIVVIDIALLATVRSIRACFISAESFIIMYRCLV
jgi:hypothetical protein